MSVKKKRGFMTVWGGPLWAGEHTPEPVCRYDLHGTGALLRLNFNVGARGNHQFQPSAPSLVHLCMPDLAAPMPTSP